MHVWQGDCFPLVDPLAEGDRGVTINDSLNSNYIKRVSL